MHFIKRVQSLCDAAGKAVSSFKQFKKDPLMWAGIASVSSVLACTYGVEPIECSIGERECIDNYAALCHAEDQYSNGHWIAAQCEGGCDDATGKCMDDKVIKADIGCENGELRCSGVTAQICVDNIWYRTPAEQYYQDGQCKIQNTKQADSEQSVPEEN